jgi:predicted RNA-binding Zn-ribbon protein involved in translation (DUF1610 family)
MSKVKIGIYEIEKGVCKNCDTEFNINDSWDVIEFRCNEEKGRTKSHYLACPNCGESDIRLVIDKVNE